MVLSVLVVVVLRQDLNLSPRLECGRMVFTGCSLGLLGSSDPVTSEFSVVGTTDMHYDGWLIFCIICRDRVSLGCSRLVSNFWPHMSLLPWSTKVLGLQA